MRRALARVLPLVCAASLVALGVAASGLSYGGRAEVAFSLQPAVGVGLALDAFADWEMLEVASTTEASLLPYTFASERLAFSIVRDWLDVNFEYEFTIVPIGITEAAIVAHAAPSPWEAAAGSLLWQVGVEAEARLTGAAFASTPLRTELWIEGTLGVTRHGLGPLDAVTCVAALGGTLSAPAGVVWPVPRVLLSAALGFVTLESETELSLAGGLHVATETVSLGISLESVRVAGEAWCTWSSDVAGASLGLRAAYEFGASPLRAYPSASECTGGVCR